MMQTPIAGPHTHSNASTGSIMLMVCLALLPATIYGLYQFGWPAIYLFLITVGATLGFEALSLYLARKPVRLYLFDGSALLTGWLVAMSLPPWAPWWIGVLGAFVAVVLGKHVFGGLGQNVFNPAMLARVTLLVSFPLEMTTWIKPAPLGSAGAPNAAEGAAITFQGIEDIDAVSSASVLGHVRTEFSRGIDFDTASSGFYDLGGSFVGNMAGSLGETSALLLLLGGLFLLIRRIINWQIPVAMLGTLALLSLVFNLIDPGRYADPLFHLGTGGLILAAFFIATDPVTSPTTARGRLLFGAGCGGLDFIIRTWGGYPEGIGFAVLLMNACTPLIDHYLRPRIYGRNRAGDPLAVSDNTEAGGKS